MKKLQALCVIACAVCFATVVFATTVENYASTINMFKRSPAVEKFFRDCYGYAVFPLVAKAGYVVGGSYGKGQVYHLGRVTGKSSVIEGSIGFQAGGEAFSEIIFFQDRRAYEEFTSGNFEFGASAEAVAIVVGAEAQAGTAGTGAGASRSLSSGVQAETHYIKGMATFVHAQGGLMLGVAIGGQRFSFQPL